VILLRLRHRLLFLLLCVLLALPTLVAQTTTMETGMTAEITREDQLRFAAPNTNGQTGLFETATADTLHHGDLSFGIYYQDYDLLAASAPQELRPLTGRRYRDMSYDLYRLSASIGYGLTDRWEISAMVPWDRIKGNGGDRAGYINGWFYSGVFSDSGMGPIRIATKFGLTPTDAPTRVSLSAFTDLGNGENKSGIASGNTNFGLGMQFTHGIGSLDASYKIVGDRSASDVNLGSGSLKLPNEFALNGGLNIPVGWWHATNWITEANARWYTGGDVKPKSPIFLVTGFRHWFGNSGWALNAGARWNIAKFSYDNDECKFTELDDCGLGGLVGLTFAPLHLAVVAPPPPPAPIAPPPPPPPAPVPPPEPPPVAPPHQPTELRTDEIHFEPGSARLTNIAKAILDDVALRMKQEPTSTAIVIGYTDNKEATGPNADLDRRRAEAVRDYLVSRHGIDASRITVEGRDGREPVGDNNTAEGRLRNRRVVIRLIIP
jgi:outer membrane protein OmpA-like peptidoglycan-associated protein